MKRRWWTVTVAGLAAALGLAVGLTPEPTRAQLPERVPGPLVFETEVVEPGYHGLMDRLTD